MTNGYLKVGEGISKESTQSWNWQLKPYVLSLTRRRID
jgi:hypothetical protein